MQFKSFLISLFLFYAYCIQNTIAQEYTNADKEKIVSILKKYSDKNETPSMLSLGKEFIGTHYAGGTLDHNNIEKLTINVRDLDCTTFVETVAALYLTTLEKSASFRDFSQNLQTLRYRNGEINEYPSRLHYFSDWIADNEKKNLLKEITPEHSSDTLLLNLYFMSKNADKYPQLAQNNRFINQIKNQEKALRGKRVYYLPKTKMKPENLSWIKNGDIIAITTSKPGLDITHVGIACYVKGELHLLHASWGQKKVIIEPVSLKNQLKRNTTQTGIRVIRVAKKKLQN
ncbi:N-acetylmuramoyl-L-alanine amidase-like domain-containing protein [Coprobacter tertius]|uniref:DUF1460 domain-containing protein n=1 Tax=Coprobacter tertius TaxID=2944915 RepID=A0ABT1MIA5_9BACT|nr:N-acetylmuramoyl-L-alanine amidase-like domain-containing protein [Coprobacter tertius]MCP9612363.1 DUF1460 domain-containing protein [Coprobacter tertius]